MLSHLAIVFNPTISIDFEEICIQEFVMEVMNHVKQLNIVTKSVELSCAALSPENYKYILDECKNVPRLWLLCEVSPDFEYRAGPDFKVDDFFVRDSHWIHLEGFSNCKTVYIHQKPDYINLEGLRALIRKWIESECQLEHFTVSSIRSTFDSKLEELELRITMA
ncbi:hypothetical protein CRE_04241 [Caenorhabditis remanei]|uniref:F-box associated domain-containing protein n=1 Tax=Caenorhabditis remanei TaxID=31234 RepID=E3MYW9_CAERE|nr:hypothetical protein CRE_04241 [Caenorhabditis remanei]